MCKLINRVMSLISKKSVSDLPDNLVETVHTSSECVHTAIFDKKQNRTIHEEYRYVSGIFKGVLDIYDYYEHDDVSTTVFHSLFDGELVSSSSTTTIKNGERLEYFYYRNHTSGTEIEKRYS